jgi:hypothetical protein
MDGEEEMGSQQSSIEEEMRIPARIAAAAGGGRDEDPNCRHQIL